MLSNQEKLLEFQKSIDRQLKGQIEKIDSEVTQYKEAQKEKIEKLLPGCSVLPSGEITIGGFIIEDEGKSFIINESLDNTLQEQKEWFYSNSGLRLTQL